jgi:glycosyltransferase involved in cell wall biosynthesis
VAAYRRVGFRGVLSHIRWRLRTNLKGRSPASAGKEAVGLAVREGPNALLRRIRWGFSTSSFTPPTSEAPSPHPWTQTFAHSAAMNPFFDLSADELAANHDVTRRFADRTAPVRSATWFLTWFAHPLFGGVHTILRFMAYLKEVHGVQHRLVVFDRHDAEDRELREKIAAVFPALADIDIVLPVDGEVPYDELPHTDIAVCTMWISAYAMARFNATDQKYYMVQDYEPAFYPAGSLSALAEATYRMGFAGIVNTPGLAEVFRAYGGPAHSFLPSVEPVERAARPDDDPVRVVVYGRPSTDRNAFELIASGCALAKRALGDRIEIVSAGEAWHPSDLGLDGVIENRGLLRSLEDVRGLYAESDIGICFMLSKHPSYQPFEYLAAGVAPICNRNQATEWMLRDEENCLVVEPFPSEIARAITRLVEEPDLRAGIAERGRRQVTSTSWNEEFAGIWDFMTGGQS